MGAADTALILDLTDKILKEFTLHITGRDVEPDDLILQFNEGQWLCLGNAEIQAQKREQKEYEDNPLVVAVKRMLQQEEQWQGSATELKKNLIKYGYDCDVAIPVMAKNLKKLMDLFKKYDDIIYTPAKPSNGNRTHKLEISSFGARTDISKLLCDSDIDDIFDNNIS